MSSAQEAVTGSSKLDMAGVMAALALARQEEAEKTGRGQKSFLHNNFRRSPGGLLVRAERVQTELEEPGSGSLGGRRKEEAGGVTSMVKSYESSAGHCDKTTSNTSTASIKLSSPRPVESPEQPSAGRKVSECRAAFENLTSNGFSSSSSSLESSPSPRQDKKWSGSLRSLRQRPSHIECESGSQTTEKQPDNTTEIITEKQSTTVNTPNIANIANTDMPDMANMAGFLAMVERVSEEKERRTGNGRLDMSELVSALNNFQSTSKAPPAAAAPTSRSPPPLPAKPPTRSAGSPPCPPPPPPVPASAPSLSERREMLSSSSTQPGRSQTTHRTKSSFLQAQLNPNNEQLPQQDATSTSNIKPSYTQEKNTLLGELKSKLNKENTVLGDGKQSLPRRNLEVANPSQDQMVNKIVYNQYREMLNSYRNNK